MSNVACARRVLAGIALLACHLAQANPADLDWSFETGGIARTVVSSDTMGTMDALLQPDGKIVGVNWVYPTEGNGFSIALVRYNANGTLDATFGSQEIVRTLPTSGEFIPYSIALEPDGDIVVAGEQDAASAVMLLIRHKGDTGELDSDFGNDGIVLVGQNFAPYSIIVARLGAGPSVPHSWLPTFSQEPSRVQSLRAIAPRLSRPPG